MECPLCNLKLKEEVVFYEDEFIVILRTRDLKGHQERIMVVWKAHYSHIPDAQYAYALMKLIDTGKRVFKYTPKFVIMEGTFQTIKQHWHLVATDLDPNSNDFEQILRTPWLEVVGTELEGIELPRGK